MQKRLLGISHRSWPTLIFIQRALSDCKWVNQTFHLLSDHRACLCVCLDPVSALEAAQQLPVTVRKMHDLETENQRLKDTLQEYERDIAEVKNQGNHPWLKCCFVEKQVNRIKTGFPCTSHQLFIRLTSRLLHWCCVGSFDWFYTNPSQALVKNDIKYEKMTHFFFSKNRITSSASENTSGPPYVTSC